jgi:transmembrane sensor
MDRSSTPASDGDMDDARRLERACDWFIELREELNSPEAVSAWLEWCAADPRNREAFEQARRVWAVTEGAHVENLGFAPPPPQQQPKSQVRGARRWKLAGAGVALAATVAAVALLGPDLLRTDGDPSLAVLHTPVGKNREVPLADGSTVVLGAGSRVVAELDASSRQLRLENGEAYFKVARDSRRPFVVSAGPVRVTALGTEFNVRAATGRVIVAVAEGLVQIDAGGDGKRAPLRVGAGETVSLDTVDASMQLAHADPITMASWQQGRLEFTREPLSAVIASVNRYSARRIEIDGAAVGDLRFTGTVFTDRLDDWVRGLPRIFPVELREAPSEVAIVAEHR